MGKPRGRNLPGFIAAGHYRIGRYEIVRLSPTLGSNATRVARWEVRCDGKPVILDNGRPLRRHTAHEAIKYAQDSERGTSK